LRLGYTVIPKELKVENESVWALWARRHGTKYNGAPYIIQKAGAAAYSDRGRQEITQQIAYYMNNAKIIREGLLSAGYEAFGGVNAPYIWLRTPNGLSSWEFFDMLLEKANVVGTPGIGFGPSGEHYFRLTAFGSKENTEEAIKRIRVL
ncbi:MAG: aminotransferase class I/II-fold pyridoxal phosphate-dependent enzyme, partial [Lachnospiraceae bacterium]|nr:aminotransferase class I/II-fold pyridoxal phosphate-dependent enzyme [Lachnospiraceae bacterium]